MATKKIAAPLFTTKRVVADRLSPAVTIKAMHFEEATRSIKVFCSDGYTRECRVDRLTSVEHGRKLWTLMETATKDATQLRFKSAGGFDPNKWFYDVTTVEAAKDGFPF